MAGNEVIDTSNLECPVCLEIMVGKIFLCKEGHSVCERCKEKGMKECPECRNALTNARNWMLENLIKQCAPIFESVSELGAVQCFFDGCKQIMPLDQKREHEQKCKYRKTYCSFCSKEFLNEQLQKHELVCRYKTVPCIYQRSGCKEKMTFAYVKPHEETCKYKSIPCTTVSEQLYKCDRCGDFLFGTEIYADKNKLYCANCKKRNSKIDLYQSEKLRQIFDDIDKAITVPCTFRKNGCLQNMHISNKIKHNPSCPFRDVSCRIFLCQWKGCIIKFYEHIISSHTKHDYFVCKQIDATKFETKFTLTDDPVQTIKRYNFLCERNLFYLIHYYGMTGGKVRFILASVALEQSLSTCKFRLEIEKNGKKLIGQGECVPDTILKSAMLHQYKFLSFNPKDFHSFINENGTYNVKLYIVGK